MKDILPNAPRVVVLRDDCGKLIGFAIMAGPGLELFRASDLVPVLGWLESRYDPAVAAR